MKRFVSAAATLAALATPAAAQQPLIQPIAHEETRVDTVWDHATADDPCVVYSTIVHTDAPRPWTGELPKSLEGIFLVPDESLPDSAQHLAGAYRLRIQKHWLGAIGPLGKAFRDLGPLDQNEVYATTCELFEEKLANPREPYFVMEPYSTGERR